MSKVLSLEDFASQLLFGSAFEFIRTLHPTLSMYSRKPDPNSVKSQMKRLCLQRGYAGGNREIDRLDFFGESLVPADVSIRYRSTEGSYNTKDSYIRFIERN
jgi:hypothetical protein